jgi:hypothetical protein
MGLAIGTDDKRELGLTLGLGLQRGERVNRKHRMAHGRRVVPLHFQRQLVMVPGLGDPPERRPAPLELKFDLLGHARGHRPPVLQAGMEFPAQHRVERRALEPWVVGLHYHGIHHPSFAINDELHRDCADQAGSRHALGIARRIHLDGFGFRVLLAWLCAGQPFRGLWLGAH